MDVWPRERKQYHSDLFGNVIKWHAGGVLSIHYDGSRPVGLSYISFDLTASNEKKLGYLTGNKSLAFRWNQTGSRLNTWPLEEGQKYELVLIWSRELCELCWAWGGQREGRGREWGGGTATSEAIIWGWDHCLAPSLHAYGSERLSQPSSTTGCVISSLSPPRCARTFFFFFFKRGILSILSAGCFGHHRLYLFDNNKKHIFHSLKNRQIN